ncbi:MAG: hypothetical protein KA419_08200 [Acidobacteria bacterium]|nr:hypothetical protein [Acidobacteriota bacterium]
MKTRLILTLGFLLALSVISGFGQAPLLKVNVDFPFIVKDTELPAGEYEFVREPSGWMFRVKDQGDHVALVTVLTTLSRETHTTVKDAHVIFDKVGDKFILSELWIPGHDGYLVGTTPKEHGHKVLNVDY